jgi:hypothetical protein
MASVNSNADTEDGDGSTSPAKEDQALVLPKRIRHGVQNVQFRRADAGYAVVHGACTTHAIAMLFMMDDGPVHAHDTQATVCCETL